MIPTTRSNSSSLLLGSSFAVLCSFLLVSTSCWSIEMNNSPSPSVPNGTNNNNGLANNNVQNGFLQNYQQPALMHLWVDFQQKWTQNGPLVVPRQAPMPPAISTMNYQNIPGQMTSYQNLPGKLNGPTIKAAAPLIKMHMEGNSGVPTRLSQPLMPTAGQTASVINYQNIPGQLNGPTIQVAAPLIQEVKKEGEGNQVELGGKQGQMLKDETQKLERKTADSSEEEDTQKLKEFIEKEVQKRISVLSFNHGRELIQLNMERTTLIGQLDEYKVLKERLEQERGTGGLKLENQNLREAVAAWMKASEDQKQQIEQLKKVLQQRDFEMSKEISQNTEICRLNDEKKAEIDDVKMKNTQLGQMNIQLYNEVNRLNHVVKQQAEERLKQVMDLENESRLVKEQQVAQAREHLEKMVGMEKENDELNKAKSEQDAKIQRLETVNKSLFGKSSALDAIRAKLDEEVSRFTSQAADQEKKTLGLEKRIQELEEEAAELVRQQDDQIDNLKKMHQDKVNKLYEEAEDLKIENEALKDDNKEEVARMKEALKQKDKSLKDMKTDNDGFKKALVNRDAKIRHLELQHSGFKDTIDGLLTDLSVLKEQKEKMVEQVEKLKKDGKNHEDRMDQWKIQASRTEKEVASLRKENAKLKDDNKSTTSLQGQIDLLQTKLTASYGKNEAIEDDYRRHREKQMQELRTADAKIACLDKTISELRAKMASKNQDSEITENAMKSQIQELQKSLTLNLQNMIDAIGSSTTSSAPAKCTPSKTPLSACSSPSDTLPTLPDSGTPRAPSGSQNPRKRPNGDTEKLKAKSSRK
ncbi:hypothetical protein L3Y34_019328 [Caenorhabditis briggsae]|uniref:Uncharacterized protein n=1 Tax=Caenorhabditis briggsae TaxID=6238 RepID=A0AAE9DMK9_CAEBR|nr:hypothetical protein L3Y34_019328 [Caenorhabditis briggsae]